MDYRRFVIGDIHGAGRALDQCLGLAGFRDDSDMLICLGDVCDSWPDTYSAIERLINIRNIKLIAGNHDSWALAWMTSGKADYLWTSQGGDATIASYKGKSIPESHIHFLANALDYYIIENRLFIHGGFNPGFPLDQQDREIFMWDRSLVANALLSREEGNENNITGFDEVYVGHTPTLRFGEKKPLKACEVWLMDTGAGWEGGVLSMMNIDTKEIYISGEVNLLYRNIKGR